MEHFAGQTAIHWWTTMYSLSKTKLLQVKHFSHDLPFLTSKWVRRGSSIDGISVHQSVKCVLVHIVTRWKQHWNGHYITGDLIQEFLRDGVMFTRAPHTSTSYWSSALKDFPLTSSLPLLWAKKSQGDTGARGSTLQLAPNGDRRFVTVTSSVQLV